MPETQNAVRQACVIGHPIAHSLSPAIHKELARAAGIRLDYTAVDVLPEDLEETLLDWRDDARFVGCNVTMPHKRAIIAFLDRCSPEAAACEAVNVVRRDGDELVGENTDLDGIAETFRLLGFEAGGKRAVIFGAGGGAQAVAAVLAQRNAAEIWIVARSPDRAKALLKRAEKAATPAPLLASLGMSGERPPPADIYINATPLGMSGQPSLTLLPRNAPKDAKAFDLVYRPAETRFLRDARARGLDALGGFPMLLEQALATFERWFAIRPNLSEEAKKKLESLACAT
ncbi:MAG: shikimate dehydrogenase [Candidatus Eremiobacteraeota bacterium]|nr:shikimate dehydrogenase [Candidatus Eremiobacteraeota bacterium]